MNSDRMLVFTNDELGIQKRPYFLKNKKLVILDNKDITLEDMILYHKQFLSDGAEMLDLLYFIDDRASSAVDSVKLNEIGEYVKKILSEEDIDIFYLANFMDNCRTIKSISSEIPENLNNIKFYYSKAPNGFYATVTTFEKWGNIFNLLEKQEEQKITSKLSTLVIKQKLKAGTTWPRIFVPDINKLKNDMDNFYTYPCRIEQNLVNSEKEEIEELSFFWFILGCSLVVFTILIMTKMIPVRKIKNKINEFNEFTFK
jgi:hypothetical protein